MERDPAPARKGGNQTAPKRYRPATAAWRAGAADPAAPRRDDANGGGGGNRPSPGENGGGNRPDRPQGRGGSPEAQALTEALQNEGSSVDEIKTKLAALREERKKSATELTQARERPQKGAQHASGGEPRRHGHPRLSPSDHRAGAPSAGGTRFLADDGVRRGRSVAVSLYHRKLLR